MNSRIPYSRYSSAALLVLGLMLAPQSALATSNLEVPSEYQALYSKLNTSLDSYSSLLDSLPVAGTSRVVLAAELLTANCNRGPSLLNPQTIQSVELFLKRFEELGIQAVTICVHYPLYTPGFPRYQEYVAFYTQVAQLVRDHGMKLDVESSVIFTNTPFSPFDFSYAGLTFERFKAERKEMVAAIVRDLRPDYLNLGAEPDTQYQLTGLRELLDPRKYAEYLNFVLNGLNRGSTKIGAGIGTWSDVDFARILAASTSLDSIHIHVYPVSGPFLENILRVADIAKSYGKPLVLDEAWLYKVSEPSELGGVAAAPEAFRRDAFSFWAPLDQKFLALMARSASLKGIEYVSAFWTNFFFAYIDYNSETARLSYAQTAALANEAVAKNVLAGEFSSTGLFYRELISKFGATRSTSTTPVSTSDSVTTSGATPPSPSRTELAFPPAEDGRSGFALVAVLLAVGVVITGVFAYRRRTKGSSRQS